MSSDEEDGEQDTIDHGHTSRLKFYEPEKVRQPKIDTKAEFLHCRHEVQFTRA